MDYNFRIWLNFFYLLGGLVILNILGVFGVVFFLAVGLYRFGDGLFVKEELFDFIFGVIEFLRCMFFFIDLGGLFFLRIIWLRGVKFLFILLEGFFRFFLINFIY